MEQKRKDCVCAKTWNKTRKGVGDPSSAAALAQHGGPSSAHLHLRLVGFEAAQSSTGCCGLGDPVAAAHSFKLALPHNLHRHPHLPVVGPLGRAAHSTKTWGSEWERRGSAARRGGGGTHLNLAVSGSISSSSLTGERGTLAENFSVMKREQSSFPPPHQHPSTRKPSSPMSGLIMG